MQSDPERNGCFTYRRLADVDVRKHLGILCVCVILLYFTTAVLDYVALFSGNWGVVTLERGHSVHVFYGPWQKCWVFEQSFLCKNHSWRKTFFMPSIFLLYSVIIGKTLFLGCLYQLFRIFKCKWYITVKISVILKVILCALSLILHVLAASLPKGTVEGKKLVFFWNSELTVIISTGLIVVMMLVLLYELFFVVKVARSEFESNSGLQTDGFMNPSFCGRSPVRSGSSVEQLATRRSVAESDFSWKDLSVEDPDDVESANRTNNLLKDEFSSDDNQEVFEHPNNDSDSCSTAYFERNFDREHNVVIHIPKVAKNDDYDTITLGMISKEPNVNNGISITGKSDNKLPTVLGIKLRANVAQKIVDGHEIVPFNQTVLLLQRNIYQEWELEEMKAHVFQNLSTSDTQLVMFEYKSNASQQDDTEVDQNADRLNDETPDLKMAHSYPYYFPQNATVPNDSHSSKCNLALPIKK